MGKKIFFTLTNFFHFQFSKFFRLTILRNHFLEQQSKVNANIPLVVYFCLLLESSSQVFLIQLSASKLFLMLC